jgi:hypothetical protein
MVSKEPQMMRLAALLLSVSTLWACAAGQGGATDPASQPAQADECGAVKFQWLVGKPKSAIPRPPRGANWRIYSTKEIITMNYVFGRMDIVWDADTGKVTSVHCG